MIMNVPSLGGPSPLSESECQFPVIPALCRFRSGSGGFKMACLVSTSFAVPLRSSPTLSLNRGQIVHELDFARSRLSRKATICTVQKIIGSCNSNKHILSVKGSWQHCLMSFVGFLHDTYSYNVDVDYCTEIVISGYWVGPDADDGWGFVEAVLTLLF